MMRTRLGSCIAALLLMGAVCFGAAPANPDLPTTAVLTFSESVFPTYIGSGTDKEVAFKAEPKYEGRNLQRGSIVISRHRNERTMGYVLDKSVGKLHLDLNRNGDLTDDPNGVVVKDESQSFYDTYRKIRFTLEKDGMKIPYIMSVTFYDHPQVSVDSGWSGEFTLNGHTWSLQIGGDLEGDLRTGSLLFRHDEKDPIPPDVHSHKVFLEGRMYDVNLSFAPSGDKVNILAELKPAKATLCHVRLAGTHVRRLALNGSDRTQGAVIYDPPAEFDLPEGQWNITNLRLVSGDRKFELADTYRMPAITIDTDQANELVFGAPLVNKIDFSNTGGSQVTLNYKLVDAAGHEYRALDFGPNPPKFEVYKAGKKIDSGKFEYG